MVRALLVVRVFFLLSIGVRLYDKTVQKCSLLMCGFLTQAPKAATVLLICAVSEVIPCGLHGLAP